MPQPKRNFRPYEQAREYVRGLGLKSVKDYEAWSKSGARPADIPGKPRVAYGAAFSWTDFLGIGGGRRRISKDGKFRPFDEARAFVRSLGLRTQKEYADWSRTGDRPSDIPSNPVNAYGPAWTQWADYLGTTREYRPFEEARAFARAHGIRTRRDWVAAAATPDFPHDLPLYPDHRYRDSGWIDWNDFLGTEAKWSRERIRSFLLDIRSLLPSLRPAELYAILLRNKLLAPNPGKARRAAFEALEALCGAPDPEAATDRALDALEPLAEDAAQVTDAAGVPAELEEAEMTEPDLRQTTEYPRLRSIRDLHTLDELADRGLADEEILEFLVTKRVSELWQATLDGDPEFVLQRLAGEPGGPYFAAIRERFLEEFRGADGLPTPDGYTFSVNGTPTPPNLMQRLTAYRLVRDRRVINASQTGAGKTLAAINAAATVGARLTVVLAVNATLDGWRRAIEQAFPGTAVLVKPRVFAAVDPARPTYLLYNYESFQQPWAEGLVRDLTAAQRVDAVVLDELQQVRWRDGNAESIRRKTVQLLLDLASIGNPGLRVLGMSATPVINDLHEARTLLELVTGQDLSDLPTRPTMPNAILVHQLLTRHGLRYHVQYQQSLDTQYPTADGTGILPRLRHLAPRDVLGMEQTVLDAKLPLIRGLLRTGTLVFTPMVTGIVDRLADAVRGCGLRPGLFTGDEKGGLAAFLDGTADVLIGSEPVGTGVDGLQRVANRLVFASLPWTSAQYEQVVGRLHRQGQLASRVEVYVPLVEVAQDGRAWSWDRLKLDRIRFKRTLADAAVDGMIAEGRLPSQQDMQADSLKALQEWITQVGAPSRPVSGTDEIAPPETEPALS